MTAVLLPQGKQYYPTATGAPLVGGKVFTYDTGTNTPRTTWADAAQTSPNTNPVILDARGEAAIFWSGAYRVVIQDSLGNAIWTMDGVAQDSSGADTLRADLADGSLAAKGAGLVGFLATVSYTANTVGSWLYSIYRRTVGELAALVTPTSYQYDSDSYQRLNVFRFFTAAQIADVVSGAGTLDVSAAVQAANDYLEGKAPGNIATFSGLVGGAGYNGGGSGTFFPVLLTGGAGINASARVTVTAGVVTACTIQGPGSAYVIGNVLSITAANMVTAGAAAGGAGATVTVATSGTGGRTTFSGGELVFPSGKYNMGTTDLRVGDMVNWEGGSIQGTVFIWSNAHTGNCVTLGPGKSGFNGRDGYYAMGCSIQRVFIQCGNNSAWGIFTLGLQQNGKIKDVWVQNVNNGGVFLKDTAGSANMLCEDVYVFGGTAMSATVYAYQINGGGNCVLNRLSCNGGNLNLLAGIRIDGGDIIVRDFQCELAATHIDVSGTAGSVMLRIDKAVFNLSAAGSLRGLWIRAGFAGSVCATAIDAGPFQLMIQNDVDGFQRSSGATAGFIPIYAFVPTVNDISNIENVVIGYKRAPNFTVNGAGLTYTPNVASGETSLINCTTVNAYTIGKPTLGPAAFPGSLQQGRRLRFQFYNSSGGVMGAVTFNAVFKTAGAFVAPATGFNRTYEFEFDGATWYEAFRTAADVPN